MNVVATIAKWRSKWTAAQEVDDLDSGDRGALAGDAAGRELPRFMQVLGVDPEKIEAWHGRIMRSMRVTCSICADTSRCRRDLDHRQALAVRSYCPNVEIIEVLKSATGR